MNGARFASRNPRIKLMSGTTRNEAYHLQLKYMWRNVVQQTGRNAEIIAGIVSVVKLLAGFIRKNSSFTIRHREHALMHSLVTYLFANPCKFIPLMDHRAVNNPKVNVKLLPKSAKTIRKRPASAVPSQTRKRPGRNCDVSTARAVPPNMQYQSFF